MAEIAQAYRDGAGKLHTTVEAATIADIAAAIGRVGEEGGLTEGIAKLIFERRSQIEATLAQHDQMVAACAPELGVDRNTPLRSVGHA